VVIMSSAHISEPSAAIRDDAKSDPIDAAVERVAAHKQIWIETPIPQRIAFLRKCLAGVAQAAEGWVRDMCAVKGFSPDDNLAGEEWLAGPSTTARNIRQLIAALAADGQPKPSKISRRPDGQYVVRIVPSELSERAMFAGVTVDVWIEPGKAPTQGRIYREPKGTGKVSLVLGGGNVSSIPPMDVLYKLFVEDEVVVLKMNPVNAVVGPHLERAFESLIDAGFLAIVYGGTEVGARLAQHPKVDTLHVTGSDRTYDAIVWGNPAEQAQRKAEKRPVNTRPFSAELGCVTPCLIVPGDWSDADLEFQARHVASMVTQNASFNCNAAKVLVTARGWKQRGTFIEKVHAALGRASARKAYYPGAETRYRGFLEKYPSAQVIGAKSEGAVPWTIIPDVPANKGEYALTNEAFCGVLAEVELDASDAREFLERAVAFANDDCWGTLSCMLLIDNATARTHSAELDRAVERLRYGSVCINAWAGLMYALASPPWGAFPGHPSTDIQSGQGVVHNTFLLDHPQKAVVRAPFRIAPTPAWFFDHKNLLGLGRNLIRLEAEPGIGTFAATALAGLKG
jgi:acyl-CoA reductase-like NAD-dependent aldehyde dehydrogenase